MCRFDDRRSGRSTELTSLVAEVVAHRPHEVRNVLDEVDRATSAGLFAGGFVSYEAAPGLDPALTARVRAGDDPLAGLPLAWFGLFAGSRPVEPPVPTGGGGPPARWSWATDRAEHARAVAAIRERIAEGWTYQANLTTHLVTQDRLDRDVLYRRLSEAQGGAYHAYLATGDWSVACASPELFFRRDGDVVTTRPMKGTAARGSSTADDLRRREAMLTSAKERAENLMIVDLVRNDLGRVAEFGSVEVPALFVAEAFPTVWQLTSSVTARLRPGVDLSDLFAALFPCGSVTGAPKAATMALLAELERRPRGVYCGAVGYVAPPDHHPRARFAVAIRTVTTNRRAGYSELGVGSGITWDSDAAGEWAELAAKATILGDDVSA